MKKLMALLSLGASLCACDLRDEVTAVAANNMQNPVWVFAQFNTPEEGEKIDSYYYYGQVSQDIYTAIAANQLQSGFILLQNAKYWGSDDVIQEFADRHNTGDLIFRIEDIRKIEGVREEPITGRGYEQFEEAPEESGEKVDQATDQTSLIQ